MEATVATPTQRDLRSRVRINRDRGCSTRGSRRGPRRARRKRLASERHGRRGKPKSLRHHHDTGTGAYTGGYALACAGEGPAGGFEVTFSRSLSIAQGESKRREVTATHRATARPARSCGGPGPRRGLLRTAPPPPGAREAPQTSGCANRADLRRPHEDAPEHGGWPWTPRGTSDGDGFGWVFRGRAGTFGEGADGRVGGEVRWREGYTGRGGEETVGSRAWRSRRARRDRIGAGGWGRSSRRWAKAELKRTGSPSRGGFSRWGRARSGDGPGPTRVTTGDFGALAFAVCGGSSPMRAPSLAPARRGP